ncbi:MAG: 3-dehydroquinate synthase II [Methanomassiliicoccales archaeon]
MRQGKPLFWFRADKIEGREARRSFILSSIEKGASAFVIRKEDEELRKDAYFDAILFEGDRVLIDGRERGRIIEIAGPQDMPQHPFDFDYLVVFCADWKIIPLENLIAMHQQTGCRIIASARSRQEAEYFLGTLEKGVDGLLVEGDRPEEFLSLVGERKPLTLTEATVAAVRPAGMGDRVCVDTTSVFGAGEGLLVGSQSSCLFLIHSENLPGRYIAPRPFRVNAGPVHSYVLLPDGKTRYLCELKSGVEVLGVSGNGKCRPLTVGRVKIERRPMLLVVAEMDGEECTTLLQNAETVRFCSPSGALPVTSLRGGEKVFVFREKSARHAGMPVQETIWEW